MRMLLVLILFLTGCAQLTNTEGASQKVISLGKGRFSVSCSGLVDNWPDCFSKARTSCTNGYEEIARKESSVNVAREMVFQCKR